MVRLHTHNVQRYSGKGKRSRTDEEEEDDEEEEEKPADSTIY